MMFEDFDWVEEGTFGEKVPWDFMTFSLLQQHSP